MQSSTKLKQLFEDRIASPKHYLQSISNFDFEGPFLNTLQFLCDILLQQPSQSHQCTQTNNNTLFSEFPKVSPIKFETQDDFFTEADALFDNSHESENLMRNVNLQSERLAKLHKQITETMQTSKSILTNPLKGEHFRSRSEMGMVEKGKK